MGIEGPSPWSEPLPIVLVATAMIGFVIAAVSAIRAWVISFGYPAFNALGWRKWFLGTAAIAYMPPAAIVHVKRYFAGFAIFLLSIVGLGIFSFVRSAPLP